MFNFLFKKKIEEDTGCKCKTFKDQDVLMANEINKLEYMESFLKRSGYKYELKTTDYINLFGENIKSHSFYLDGIEDGIGVDKKTKIRKYACLSCKTCLGWHYSYYTEGKSGIKSLDKYFQEKIDNHIQKIRKEEQRIKLAKEICEC